MAEAGLTSKIDGVGNVIGYARKPGQALLMGSHTDTQPEDLVAGCQVLATAAARIIATGQ